MNKEDIEELEQELQNRYNGYEINIEFTGAVALFFKIQNLKSFISMQTILLSNGEYKELEIQADMVTGIEILEDNIEIDMFDNYKIQITRVENSENFATAGGEKVKEENVNA